MAGGTAAAPVAPAAPPPAACAAPGEGAPAGAPGAAAVDVAQFHQVLDLPALRVPARRVGELQKIAALKAMFFRHPGVRNVVAAEGPGAEQHRAVLLRPDSALSALPEAARQLVESGAAEFVTHRLELGYDKVSAEDVLRRLLPEGVEVPRGFETVGHLAHFNLREPQLPYRKLIGQVILDKNPSLKTVVTKVGALTNEFRTFDMEVIAGRDDTDVIVSERGLKLRFNFRQVYWNSRLSEERVRLLGMVEPGDVVCDLFAGVGAFALLCASQGNRVIANDLNPAGADAIRSNAALNRLDVEVHNLCARACVRALGGAPALRPRGAGGPPRVHAVMNLPELALDFLDAFQGMAATGLSALFSGSAMELAVHCYCFAREKDRPEAEVHPRLLAALGCVPEGTRIREVRDVAPKKNMYCVEFRLALGAAAEGAAEGAADGGDSAKRQKTQ